MPAYRTEQIALRPRDSGGSDMQPVSAVSLAGSTSRDFRTDLHHRRLTLEQTMNYVLSSFREEIMFRAVVEEAAALASISLFLGMIAVWAQVLSAL